MKPERRLLRKRKGPRGGKAREGNGRLSMIKTVYMHV
jgi:hypothetical protein